MAKKKKGFGFNTETQEEKEARWAKNLKIARTMARLAGLDKKAEKDRKELEAQKKAQERSKSF